MGRGKAHTYQLVEKRGGESTYRRVDGGARGEEGVDRDVRVLGRKMVTVQGLQKAGLRGKSGGGRDYESDAPDARERKSTRRPNTRMAGRTSPSPRRASPFPFSLLFSTHPTYPYSFHLTHPLLGPRPRAHPPHNQSPPSPSTHPLPSLSRSRSRSHPQKPSHNAPTDPITSTPHPHCPSTHPPRIDSALPTPERHISTTTRATSRNTHPKPKRATDPKPKAKRVTSPFSQPGMSLARSHEFVFGGVNGAILGVEDGDEEDQDQGHGGDDDGSGDDNDDDPFSRGEDGTVVSLVGAGRAAVRTGREVGRGRGRSRGEGR